MRVCEAFIPRARKASSVRAMKQMERDLGFCVVRIHVVRVSLDSESLSDSLQLRGLGDLQSRLLVTCARST